MYNDFGGDRRSDNLEGQAVTEGFLMEQVMLLTRPGSGGAIGPPFLMALLDVEGSMICVIFFSLEFLSVGAMTFSE